MAGQGTRIVSVLPLAFWGSSSVSAQVAVRRWQSFQLGTPPWRGGGDGPTQEQKPHFKVALGCPHLKFVSAAGTTRTDSDSTYTTSGSSRYQDLCADKTQSTYPLITFLTARTAVHFTNQLTHQHVFLRPKPSIQPIKSPRLKAVISPWEPASKSQNAHSL